MSPYRQMEPRPLGPRWGVTRWKKLSVWLVRWWKPVRCREHGMLQPGVKVKAYGFMYPVDWRWGCPTCELRRLHEEAVKIHNIEPQEVQPWMLGESYTTVAQLLEAHKTLRTTSGGPS